MEPHPSPSKPRMHNPVVVIVLLELPSGLLTYLGVPTARRQGEKVELASRREKKSGTKTSDSSAYTQKVVTKDSLNPNQTT